MFSASPAAAAAPTTPAATGVYKGMGSSPPSHTAGNGDGTSKGGGMGFWFNNAGGASSTGGRRGRLWGRGAGGGGGVDEVSEE